MKNPSIKNYFIAKFEAIPEELWCTGSLTEGDRHCVYGHCHPERGANSPEGKALCALAPVFLAAVNDGRDKAYQQSTPKQRILAALRDLP